MPAPRLDMTVKIMLRNSTSPVCGIASVFRGLLNSPCSVIVIQREMKGSGGAPWVTAAQKWGALVGN